MKLRIYTVDAFASKSFQGNPAAIIPLDKPLESSEMQQIASEINLSETAFLTPPKGLSSNDESFSWNNWDRFGLRWFTPTNEVILCGHATLASAHVLFECIGNTSSTLQFETLSGILLAKRNYEFAKFPEAIMLDFPKNSPVNLQSQSDPYSEVVKEITSNVGVEVSEVLISHSALKLLIRLEDGTSRALLESLRPSMQRLLDLHDGSVFKGVIVTIKGNVDDPYDFLSRYFAPWNGIPEDPVTGSAHTVLAPYWSEQLGENTMACRQCSSRGGDLMVRLNDEGRVEIIGTAKTIIEGHINI